MRSHYLVQSGRPGNHENPPVLLSKDQTYTINPDAPFYMWLGKDAKNSKRNQSTKFANIHRDQIVCLKVASYGAQRESTAQNFYFICFPQAAEQFLGSRIPVNCSKIGHCLHLKELLGNESQCSLLRVLQTARMVWLMHREAFPVMLIPTWQLPL